MDWIEAFVGMGVSGPEFDASYKGDLLDNGPAVSNFLHECARRRSGRPVRR